MPPDPFRWLRILLWLAFLVFALLHLNGCAGRKQSALSTQHSAPTINILVPVSCLTKPVKLENCKDSDPKKCRGAKVSFKPECAEVEVIQK